MHHVRFTPTPTRASGNVKSGIYKAVHQVTAGSNAYAFIGDFLRGYEEVELPEGTVVVRKDYSRNGWLWYVGKVDASQPCGVAWGDAWPIAKFLSFRDHVAAVLNEDTLDGYDEEYANEAVFVELRDDISQFLQAEYVDASVNTVGRLAAHILHHFNSRDLLKGRITIPQWSNEIPVSRDDEDLENQRLNRLAEDLEEAKAA